MPEATDADNENSATNQAPKSEDASHVYETAPTTLPEREDNRALTVVGMGGSAGSIPAFGAFFGSVAPDSGSAFIVVLHLSPEHESHMAELLGRSTRMPVRQVTGPVRLLANQVYVIPPGKYLEMQDGTVDIREPDDPSVGSRVAIDHFFRTLATSHGPQAAAIVFSGTGADGTLGIRQIKEYGGLTVAQSPGEAQFDAMPRSAVATGMVDYVLPAAAMPAQIAAYWETSRRMRIPEEAAPSPEQREEGPEQETALVDVLAHVRALTGHDFGNYKRATILRRIGRRMQVNGVQTLPAYHAFLHSHSDEIDALIGDLLISVTQFFRDPAAWDALERDIVSQLVEGLSASDEVRAWVCGCATGEEAYSLAILLMERVERMAHPPRVQIFATDMDSDALSRARIGIYPETIAGDVTEARLRRWFYRHNGGYQIRKEVRESVLFAQHDVLRDTPFSRLDLVTCRNLLIYLNRAAQERVFNTFHFALRADGYLMLGSSESAETVDGLFSQTDRLHRLHMRRSIARAVVPPLPSIGLFLRDRSIPPTTVESDADLVGGWGESPSALYPMPATESPSAFAAPRSAFSSTAADARLSSGIGTGGGAGSGRDLFQSLMERYGPPTVLINTAHNIVHLSVGSSRFLRVPEGEPTYNLLQLVHPGLRVELRAALYAATTEGVEQARLVPGIDDLPPLAGEQRDVAEPSAVRLVVRPVEGATSGAPSIAYLLVEFQEVPNALLGNLLVAAIGDRDIALGPETLRFAETRRAAEAASAAATADTAYQLEEENTGLQRQLRVTVEQYEALTEEMKASNEELQATNEEMRSVAEELETGKEELQSVNEELSTVNLELKSRVEEITNVNSDLQNFLASTHIGTIFLDRALQVKRYTPAAESLFSLIPADIGRPLAHLTNQLHYPKLTEDAAAVLARLVPIEREVPSANGREFFLARLLPYRSLDDRIEGVVLTFINITERQRATTALRESEAAFRAISDAAPALVWVCDASGANIYFNERWHSFTGQTEDDSRGYGWAAAMHPDDAERIMPYWERCRQTGELYEGEVRYRRSDGVYRWHHFRALPRRNALRAIEAWYGVSVDVHDSKTAEEALRASEERFRLMVDGARDYAMFLLDVEGNITFWSTGAERVFGWRASEVMGQPMTRLFTPEDQAAGLPEREMEDARDTGRSSTQGWHPRKNGSLFWADGVLMRLDDEEGGVRGYAKVARDSTHQKRGEEALQRAMEAVADANLELDSRVQARTEELAERTEELVGINQMRQELLRQLVSAQEQERGRIARDLHDDTGQQVTALLLGLNNLKAAPALAGDPAAQTLLTGLQELAGEVAQKSHRLSFTLRPTMLDDLGLMRALRNYAEEWMRWSGLPVELEAIGIADADKSDTADADSADDSERLPPEVETTIYRVVQEALTNVLRYATGSDGRKAATRVSIVLQHRRRADDSAKGAGSEVLTVTEDDGPGFDVEAVLNQPPGKRRLGIFGMQERARLVGGTLEVESTEGEGTSVYLRIPL